MYLRKPVFGLPAGLRFRSGPFTGQSVIITAGARGLPPPSSGSTPARRGARRLGPEGTGARNTQGALVGPGDRLSPAGYPRLGSGQGVKCAAHSLTSARRRVAKPFPSPEAGRSEAVAAVLVRDTEGQSLAVRNPGQVPQTCRNLFPHL